MVTFARFWHSRKAYWPIVSIFLPNESVVRESHSVKAFVPMEVTLCGMVTFVRAQQYQKASLPIVVIFSPNLSVLSFAQ